MFFKIVTTLRKVFFGVTMLGLVTWHSDYLPSAVVVILDYLIPIAALLAVINEIAYVVYLWFYFERVNGVVIPMTDSQDNNLTAKNYEIKFEYNGMEYFFPHQDGVFSSTINGRSSCSLLVHKRPPAMVFIDTFSQRYLYLIISGFLLWSLYSVYKNGI